jgi:hypothetical protein
MVAPIMGGCLLTDKLVRQNGMLPCARAIWHAACQAGLLLTSFVVGLCCPHHVGVWRYIACAGQVLPAQQQHGNSKSSCIDQYFYPHCIAMVTSAQPLAS